MVSTHWTKKQNGKLVQGCQIIYCTRPSQLFPYTCYCDGFVDGSSYRRIVYRSDDPVLDVHDPLDPRPCESCPHIGGAAAPYRRYRTVTVLRDDNRHDPAGYCGDSYCNSLPVAVLYRQSLYFHRR